MEVWKAKARMPMTEWQAYELLGEMIKAKVTWEQAEPVLESMVANDPRLADTEPKMRDTHRKMHMLESDQRFRSWLTKT